VRTTLDIDDELLLTVKEIAQQRKTTAVTAELVNRLREEDECGCG